MSTDKTLADVQPGGMVRLGDALMPCPFCGNDAEFVPYKNNGLTLKCKSMGCIQRHQRTLRYGIDWLRTSMTEHWNARVLSAQPSPGGQDALKALDDLAAFCSDDTATVDRHVAVIRAALAARQPVGEPAYNSAGISLTACQLHEALLMAGDPELDVPFEDRSLVRIFWTETGHSGPGLYCECVGAEEEGCILLDGTAPAIGQSAQAVDLPYSLDADQAGIRARVCDVITGTLMVGAQGHTPPPAGHWAEPFWKAARADAAAQAVDLERFRPAVMTALGLSSPYGLERETLNGLLDLIDSHGARNG
ncbi:TPA: hypothetical protein ACGY71_001298 [Stenotrophomonas maltophilia]